MKNFHVGFVSVSYTHLDVYKRQPLALSVTRATTYADALAVEGVTLPGATVEVKKGRSTVTAAVDENGRFSFELATKKQGNYSFSVRAVYSGYRRSELKAVSYTHLDVYKRQAGHRAL